MPNIITLPNGETAALIPGFTGYAVTEHGVIWKLRGWSQRPNMQPRPVALKFNKRNGYFGVGLLGDQDERRYSNLQRWVAMAWSGLPPTKAHQACHENGVKSDYHYKNIYWGTAKQNGEDKVRLGESSKGEKNGWSKLTTEIVLKIKALHRDGVPQTLIAKMVKQKIVTVNAVVRGRNWGHVCLPLDQTPKDSTSHVLT